MKKSLIVLLLAVSSLSMVVSEVQAKRMGGGGSIGRQSQHVNRPMPAQSHNNAYQSAAQKPAVPATPAATPPKPASPWKGILGGALLGLGAGALLSHLGLGGALGGMLGSILMIALLAMAAMFIYRMFARKNDSSSVQSAYSGLGVGAAAGTGGYPPNYGSAYPSNDVNNSTNNSTTSSSSSLFDTRAMSSGSAGSTTPEIGSRIGVDANQPTILQATPFGSVAGSSDNQARWGVPADFDEATFLRHAKTYFIRLQAAWDKADIVDIREFTTTEMYAELKLQLQERGTTPNVTDVISINAELLGIETIGNEYLASVKFSGMIKESSTAPAENFAEIWNMSKPVNGGSGWVLAGIQQLS